MARENQGLQIALIILVMLTIILGVTTFLFFREYKDATLKATESDKKAQETANANQNIMAENRQLRVFIGFPDTEDMPTMEGRFTDDMEKYGANLAAEEQTYRNVLASIWSTVENKNIELAAAKVEVQDWKDKYVVREASTDTKFQELTAGYQKVGADFATKTRNIEAERARVTADQAALAQRLADARKQSAAKTSKLESDLQAVNENLADVEKVRDDLVNKLDEFKNETFTVPDGSIRWVNQGTKTAWIDLGRADGLTRQISFAVYPADTTDLSGGGKKASIEVVQITGEHQAEARIIQDSITDPIMPGDKIHTPIWTPGEKKRFAIAGFIDINGDGRSDQQQLINLITMNGGVIDCQTDPSGKMIGQMSYNTRYLVLGDRPTASGQQGVIAGYSRMMDDAKKFNVKTIPVAELLQQMGWKKQGGAVTFGRGSNPDDFKPRTPPGRTTMSRGSAY